MGALDRARPHVLRLRSDQPAEELSRDLVEAWTNTEVALRSLVRELATTLADPEWARILPALIQLKQQIPELQQLSEGDTEEKLHVLQRVLCAGVEAGALPADVDVHLVAHVLIGPMLFAALSGSGDDIVVIGDYCVDRLLASYRP